MKIKIGITGQDGFIGKHLYNHIGLFSDDFERVHFQKEFFEIEEKLRYLVSELM